MTDEKIVLPIGFGIILLTSIIYIYFIFTKKLCAVERLNRKYGLRVSVHDGVRVYTKGTYPNIPHWPYVHVHVHVVLISKQKLPNTVCIYVCPVTTRRLLTLRLPLYPPLLRRRRRRLFRPHLD